MSLADYAGLKASVQDWSHRNDVGTKIDDFIDLAESEMWKRLRIRDMQARATATTNGRFLALPDGFTEMRKLELQSGGISYELRFQTPESMNVLASSNRPRHFTVTTQLEFDRTPDASYTIEMQYWKTLTALSSSNTTNAVLTRFPSIYLYGSLWALNNWADNEEKTSRYWQQFSAAIDEANRQESKARYGPAPYAKVESSTP